MSTCFDIVDHGAVPDGKTLNSAAIQRAIDACHEAGGGRVWCGPGVFVTGSVMLKSHVELHLARGCRLVGSDSLADYQDFIAPGFHHQRSPEKGSKYLIGGEAAADIGLTGPGTIDGAGLAFYGPMPAGKNKHDKPDTPRPRLLMLHNCRDVRIHDLTLVDSPCWTCWLMRCRTVVVRGITIRGDRRMRNVDGIDIDSCRGVVISDCVIDTEDDCLAIRAMQGLYDEPVVCEDVVVSNCVLSSGCQCVRVGCPSDGVIRRCVMSNLVMRGSGNGIVFDNPPRYQHAGLRGADIHDIQFNDIAIHCKRSPIKVTIGEGIQLTRLANLRFTGIQARGGAACVIQGNENSLIENVVFDGVEIEIAGPQPLVCEHCRGVKLRGVELSTGCVLDGDEPEAVAGGVA